MLSRLTIMYTSTVKESLKAGKKKIEDGIVYNYTTILPVFDYQDASARALASG